MIKAEKTDKREVGLGQLLTEIYNRGQEDMAINITEEHYSNISYIQTTPRDISIDFMILPDLPKDGKRTINGIRVHLTHVAAQKLAKTLLELISKNQESGMIEPLRSMAAAESDKK